MKKAHKNPSIATFERLKEEGIDVLDFVQNYLDNLGTHSVSPRLKPGDLAAQFASSLSASGKEFSQVMKEFESKILPGVTNWQHPGFMSFYPASTSMPAILSELLIAALGTVGLQWQANPIGTELECVVMDWLMKMLHAEEGSPFLHSSMKGGGLIQNTAGDAMVVTMTAARVRKHHQLTGRKKPKHCGTRTIILQRLIEVCCLHVRPNTLFWT